METWPLLFCLVESSDGVKKVARNVVKNVNKSGQWSIIFGQWGAWSEKICEKSGHFGQKCGHLAIFKKKWPEKCPVKNEKKVRFSG